MRRLGFQQVYRDQAGNIIGRVGKGTQRLLFDGHMDTVGVGNPATGRATPSAAACRTACSTAAARWT